MAYGLQFGTVVLPILFYPEAEDYSAAAPSTKLPRADGAVQRIGYLDKRKVTVRGTIIHNVLSLGAFRTQLDTIKAAIRSQGQANLYIETDRYYRNAQPVATSFQYNSLYSRIAPSVQIDFECGDPFQYSTATSSVSASGLTSGSTITATPTGNAYSQPQFSLTAAATGAIAATVTNTLTGEAFTLAGTVTSGNVIVVDSLNETVQIGATDYTALFNGIFPRLSATANAITINWTGTVSVTAAQVGWLNRWY